ncbi:MAG: hypothetical protein M3362_10310 [Acidobacteriota bacterium]|nr:hypothetical protein [Acidobacteriota bacterium]
MRILAAIALTAVTVVAVILSGGSKSTANVPNHDVSLPNSLPLAQTPDPPGTINGAEHPEMIPDHAAYAAIFRMVSNRHTPQEINSIRAYVRLLMGLGVQGKCRSCRPSVGVGDADIDAFLAAAEEYHQRVSIIDAQAADIKDRTWPNPSPDVMAQLKHLQKLKENLAIEIMASLPQRLSGEGWQRVRQHINEHVKQRVKLVPEPTTPPGGDGWLPGAAPNAVGHQHSQHQ